MTALHVRRALGLSLGLVWLISLVAGIVLPRTLTIFDFAEKWLDDLRIVMFSPRMESREDIVLLSITEDTLSQFPYRSPVDRGVLADTLNYLSDAGVKAVGFDILFDRPTELDKDREFAAEVANFPAPVVISWADQDEGMTARQVDFLSRYLPQAVKAYAYLLEDDSDGTVRRIFPGRRTDVEFRPSFPMALAEIAGIKVPERATRLIYRMDANGGVPSFPTFQLHDINLLPKQWFAGKIVLIGTDLPHVGRHRTPFAAFVEGSAGSLSDVMIHALALAQFLDGAEIEEPGMIAEFSIVALCAALGVMMAALGLAAILKVGLSLLVIAAIWGAGVAIYGWVGNFVPVFTPMIGFAIAFTIGNAVISQISRRERLRAEADTHARSEFLATMSHELRTPLNAIIGFSDIMKAEMLGPIGSPKYLEYSRDIHASGEHLLDLINDVLDLSKIDAGKMELHERFIDVASVIDACISMIKERALKSEIKLEVRVRDSLPALWADERKLKQILINLLSNAVKFTPSGGRIVLEAKLAQDKNLMIIVSDTGVGIAAKDIPVVMEQFGQASPMISRQSEGTGLGLPMAKALIELHGGTFDLQSKLGVGTSVSLRFPTERIQDIAA